MIVAADGTLAGTVGGGMVEDRVVERCRAMLASEPAVERLAWDLASEEAGRMVCGGRMELLLEPFGVRPRAFVFGGGHVGLALARVLAGLRFHVTVVDDRADLLAPDRLPGARTVCDDPASAAASLEIPPEAFCVVTNKTHLHDLACLRALLRRDLRYVGLMSSRRKRAELFGTLEAEGVPRERLERVKCPVGLAIGAETPEEIAVSIAAEMIAVSRGTG
jgi:xanthine dehydrogenase accessory factor